MRGGSRCTVVVVVLGHHSNDVCNEVRPDEFATNAVAPPGKTANNKVASDVDFMVKVRVGF